jgi:Insulinase (Peptidase family M16)
MKKDVGKALSILGDILLNSKLDESAIVRERDVILREMEEVSSSAVCASPVATQQQQPGCVCALVCP